MPRSAARSDVIPLDRGEYAFQPAPGFLIRRQAKAKPVPPFREIAYKETGAAQGHCNPFRIFPPGQPEQVGTSEHLESVGLEKRIQPPGCIGEAHAHGAAPFRVLQRCARHVNGGARNRPGAKQSLDRCDRLPVRHQKA